MSRTYINGLDGSDLCRIEITVQRLLEQLVKTQPNGKPFHEWKGIVRLQAMYGEDSKQPDNLTFMAYATPNPSIYNEAVCRSIQEAASRKDVSWENMGKLEGVKTLDAIQIVICRLAQVLSLTQDGRLRLSLNSKELTGIGTIKIWDMTPE